MQDMPPTAATAPSGPWAGFLLRGLRNQLLCALIALLIWLMTSNGRGSLLTAWIYSAAIGTLCWLFIDAGRLLLASGLLYGVATGLFAARALRVMQQRAQPTPATAAVW